MAQHMLNKLNLVLTAVAILARPAGAQTTGENRSWTGENHSWTELHTDHTMTEHTGNHTDHNMNWPDPDRTAAPCEVCYCHERVHVPAGETAAAIFYWLADSGEGEFEYSGPHPAGSVSSTSGWYCEALAQHQPGSNDTAIPAELIGCETLRV
eukprot:SAG31_NODE_6174_length_2137_cov_1.915113_1_plen_153_part_00